MDEAEVATKYFQKPYYLEPGKGGAKAYVLLREALEDAKKLAVARMVFRDREDLVVIKPDGDLLILNQLRFADEMRDPGELKIPSGVPVTRDEIKIAVELIGKMKGKFDPKKYHDTYAEKLMKIIEDKAKGKKLKPLPKQPKMTPPADLVAQLRASLEAQRS